MQVPKDRHGLSSGFYSLDSSTTISYNILVCSCLFLAGIVSIWKDSPLRFHLWASRFARLFCPGGLYIWWWSRTAFARSCGALRCWRFHTKLGAIGFPERFALGSDRTPGTVDCRRFGRCHRESRGEKPNAFMQSLYRCLHSFERKIPAPFSFNKNVFGSSPKSRDTKWTKHIICEKNRLWSDPRQADFPTIFLNKIMVY